MDCRCTRVVSLSGIRVYSYSTSSGALSWVFPKNMIIVLLVLILCSISIGSCSGSSAAVFRVQSEVKANKGVDINAIPHGHLVEELYNLTEQLLGQEHNDEPQVDAHHTSSSTPPSSVKEEFPSSRPSLWIIQSIISTTKHTSVEITIGFDCHLSDIPTKVEIVLNGKPHNLTQTTYRTWAHSSYIPIHHKSSVSIDSVHDVLLSQSHSEDGGSVDTQYYLNIWNGRWHRYPLTGSYVVHPDVLVGEERTVVGESNESTTPPNSNSNSNSNSDSDSGFYCSGRSSVYFSLFLYALLIGCCLYL